MAVRRRLGRWVPPGIASIGVGGALCLVLLVGFLLGPGLSPYGSEEMSADAMLLGPSLAHPFGTDNFGRDVLSRVLVGARTTLSLALAASAAGLFAGAVIGLLAGFRGGLIDQILMRTGDVAMAIPSLILAMLVIVAMGSGNVTVIVAIAIVFAPRAARILRSAALNIRELDFIAAARVLGESENSILLRELLPNMWPFILVEACIRLSYAILMISALGYLGVGVQPPTPDWGLMIADAAGFITSAPWMIAGPSAAIVFCVVAVNLLGEEMQLLIQQHARRPVSSL
jgi:peptide/nickel transport system permease protein